MDREMPEWKVEGFGSELAYDLQEALHYYDSTPPECWDIDMYEDAAKELAEMGYVKISISAAIK